MRFIVGDGHMEEQEGGEEDPARDGRESGQEMDGRVERDEDREGVEEGEGAAEGGGRESAAGKRVDGRNSGGATRGGQGKGRQQAR